MTIGIITIVLVFVVLGIIACRCDFTHLSRPRTPAELDQEYVINGVVTHIPTDAELEELSDANWRSIDQNWRTLCINHLKAQVPDGTWRYWKREGFPKGFHFGGGMAVRNCLRDVLLDKNLPRDKNWDDYYMGCLHEILREMK